ncbi:MAG: glycosyltransferase family 2 protein [Rhodospirillales bacterium]|nr:glycosyltransferase family 2 protein [Rhodospirillales bacterium]
MNAIEVSIIICVYNEKARIEAGLEDVLASVAKRSERVEILVIDNCSTDGTREWLQANARPEISMIFNERNLGKGGSIKKGIAASKGRFVVIHDPDLEYRADDIWTMVDCMRETGASMVLGSRILSQRPNYAYITNYWGVIFLTTIINVLFGCRLTDSATATKLMNGDLIRNMRWRSNGFNLDFELVAQIAHVGGKVLECQAHYAPRTKSEGKKIRAVKDGIESLLAILRCRLISRSSIIDDEIRRRILGPSR